MRCAHGLDSRFCAICNRTARDTGASRPGSRVSGTSLDEIVRFLNEEQVRATYGAVAEMLGIPPRSMAAQLGDRRPEVSWIVNQATGLPTDYSGDEVHPALLSRGDIISSGRELALRMTAWRQRRPL
jgi:hypothetical protein